MSESELKCNTCKLIADFLKSDPDRPKRYKEIISFFGENNIKNHRSKGAITNHLRDLVNQEFVHENRSPGKVEYSWSPLRLKKVIYDIPLAIMKTAIYCRIDNIDTQKVFHSITYNIMNQFQEPAESFKSYIWGDTEKEWKELEPNIYEILDEKKILLYNEQRPPIFDKDQPNHKSFSIRFSRPLFRAEKTSILIEYEWEEPKQFWEFTNNFMTENLSFILEYRKPTDYELFVNVIEPITGSRKIAQEEPTKEEKKDRSLIQWQSNDPIPGKNYRFEWKKRS